MSPMRLRATVSAHVLILEKPMGIEPTRILLAKLAYRDHRAGKWSYPGGFVDQGEGLENALKREVVEEIGLQLDCCRYLETVPVLLAETPNIGFIFTCDRWSGTPGPISREILETLWVNEEQFWHLDREGLLAYPQMRDQTRCLGWQPPGGERPVNPGSGRCIWSQARAILAILGIGSMLAMQPAAAGESASPPVDGSTEEALEQAREHLLEAMKALGKAGQKSYEERLPTLKEKAGEALEETQKLLREMQERLPEQLEKLKPELGDPGRRGDAPAGQPDKRVPGTTQI
ncbi:MAG: NUDIX domain-containing protein [Magnetococcus sp. YQC-9]